MVSREEVLAQEFAYYTECNLATLEELKAMKSSSKYRIKRQEDICNQMVNICKCFNVPTNFDGRRMPRLLERLGAEARGKTA